MAEPQMLEPPKHTRSPERWWRLLYAYLSEPSSMRQNPLLARVLRRQARPPTWLPKIGSLWLFPLIAVSAVFVATVSLGESGGTSAAVGIGFAAGLCAYFPYLLASGTSLLIPARVAPAISREVEARTLDILRLTNVSPDEIVLGKLFEALIPYEYVVNAMVTFFILVAILAGLGAGAVPVVLGLPAGQSLAAITFTLVPMIFGPIVNLFFISALSLAVSAYSSRPADSIFLTYSLVLVYWILTALALDGLLAFLSESLPSTSAVLRAYTGRPVVFLFPNPFRLLVSLVLSPLLIHLAIHRVRLS